MSFRMFQYTHPLRSDLLLTKQSIRSDKSNNDPVYRKNVGDSDEDEQIAGPPKLSNFGTALLTDHNHNSTVTKFQYYRSNKYPQTLNTENRIRHAGSELEDLLTQETPSPSSSSSIFASTVNQTSIRPSSITTIRNNNNNNNNIHATNSINNSYSKPYYESNTLQILKQSMTKDETALSEKILERRNNRRLSRT